MSNSNLIGIQNTKRKRETEFMKHTMRVALYQLLYSEVNKQHCSSSTHMIFYKQQQ